MWTLPSRRTSAASRPTDTPSLGAQPLVPRGGRWRRLSPASSPELVPRVLVADPIAEAGINPLREHADVDVELRPSPSPPGAPIPQDHPPDLQSATRLGPRGITARTPPPTI